MNFEKKEERAKLREARIMTIISFVQAHTDRIITLPSLARLSDQDLHLLAAAIDNA